MNHALKARRFFPLASRRQAASQAIKYAKAVQYLGHRWIILDPVKSKVQPL